jgi:DNA-binding CsgD family transcriptional regulator
MLQRTLGREIWDIRSHELVVPGAEAVTEADAAWWFDQFRASMRVVSHLLFGSLVVDAATGDVVGCNPRAAELLGGVAPGSLTELVDAGVVSDRDLEAMTAPARAPAPETWRTDLTLQLPQGDSTVRVTAASVDDPPSGARAIVAMLRDPDQGENVRLEPALPDPAPSVQHVLYDQRLRIRGSDPRMVAYGVDPTVELGTLIWVYIHPADIHRAQPPLQRLVAGDASSAEYTVRIRTPWGNWTPASFEVRRMVSDADAPILATFSLVGDFKQTIAPGLLTPREMEIVGALFDGWRVPRLAERDGVSVKTLRNQLTAIYRKLDVQDQGELLATHHRPPVSHEVAPAALLRSSRSTIDTPSVNS